jgi:hypothetical protein
MTRLFKLAAITVAVLFGFAIGPALAAPNAFVKKDADVLKNPTPASTVIDSVDKNELVTILDCKANFCLIKEVGGWVKQSVLGPLKKGKPNANAPFSFSFGVGGDGKPSIQFGINDPSVIIDDEEDDDPQVCFYKSANFKGSSRCAEPGDSEYALSGSWDDNISSIEVLGGAEALVCRDEDLESCVTITSSKKTLPGNLDNRISSYEIN